jgi:N6-adenosine-specific RNA methylase IME4
VLRGSISRQPGQIEPDHINKAIGTRAGYGGRFRAVQGLKYVGERGGYTAGGGQPKPSLVAALKKENMRLNKRIFDLEAKLLSAQNEIKLFKRTAQFSGPRSFA